MNHVRGNHPEGGLGWLTRVAPGLELVRTYQRAWIRHDLVAGISVAAIAVPTAVAYAQISGFSPVVGLYAGILPLIAYAIFGTSRHLIVNPDAATCAMVAAICAPLAAGDPGARMAISASLACVVGLMCIAGGFFRLGFIADFLSRPILVGLLNGVAISILVGQLGTVLGFKLVSSGVFPQIGEVIRRIGHIHAPTAILSGCAIVVLIVTKRFAERIPGPLVVMVLGGVVVAIFGLSDHGVAVVGSVSGDLPALRMPELTSRNMAELLGGAFGLSLVVFSKGMVQARIFANRNRYEVDPDKELIAVGAANIAAGLSQSFAVCGTDSRTAIADDMGGKSQVTGLVVAGIMLVTLLFLTGPIAYLPSCALAAVLVMSSVGLFEWHQLRKLLKVSRGEFVLSVITALSVAALGVLPGMGFAVALAILRVLALSRKPHDAILGRVAGVSGFHNVEDFSDAKTITGLAIYRFESSLVFYNSPFFKQRALQAASTPGLKWFLLDASSIPSIDATGAETVEELREALEMRGIVLAVATARHKVRNMLGRAGTLDRLGDDQVHPTIKSAVRAYYHATQDPEVAELGVRIKPKAAETLNDLTGPDPEISTLTEAVLGNTGKA